MRVKKTGTLEQCFEDMDSGRNLGYYAFAMKMWFEELIYQFEEHLEVQKKRMTSGECKVFVNFIKELKLKKGWKGA